MCIHQLLIRLWLETTQIGIEEEGRVQEQQECGQEGRSVGNGCVESGSVGAFVGGRRYGGDPTTPQGVWLHASTLEPHQSSKASL